MTSPPTQPAEQPAEQPGGWPLRAIDVDLRLDVQDQELDACLSDLLAAMRDIRRESPANRDEKRGSTGEVVIAVRGQGPWSISSPHHRATAATRQEAVSGVLTAVNTCALRSTNTLALHAGVVAKDGRAIVLPGRSGHGKTTLTAALVSAGWRYVSDEALCLQWSGRHVIPYPRPLALSPWAAELLGVQGVPGVDEVVIPAQALDDTALNDTALSDTALSDGAGGGLVVRDIVTFERRPGPPLLAPVHRSDSVAALLNRGFTHYRRPALALQTLSAVITESRSWHLTLDDPRQAALLLTEQLG